MLSNRVRCPLEVVRLDAALGGGPLRQQPLEHAPRDPDHAVALADLNPRTPRPAARGIPVGVLGAGEDHRRLRRRLRRAYRVRPGTADQAGDPYAPYSPEDHGIGPEHGGRDAVLVVPGCSRQCAARQRWVSAWASKAALGLTNTGSGRRNIGGHPATAALGGAAGFKLHFVKAPYR
jgi:hypothetical protein